MPAANRHFMLLDGLRGVATLPVVTCHFGGRDDLPYLLPRSFLAPDYFLAVGGFVLAYAYWQRLCVSPPTSTLVKRRPSRLLPILIPGTVFGDVLERGKPQASRSPGHVRHLAGDAGGTAAR